MEVNGLRLKALQHLAWQVYYSEKSIMYMVIHGGVWDTWLRTGGKSLYWNVRFR